MKSDSKSVVYAALIGNLSITLIKFITAFFTRSASMLAEAIHSLADSFNQLLLLVGDKRSKRPNDENHPFGYGREEFFWAFIVAILLFFGGAMFSIYEGIHKFDDIQPVKYFWVSMGVFGASFAIEGWAFYKAWKASREHSEGNLLEAVKASIDVNLVVVLLEDSAALLGLVIATVCTIISLWFPVFDAIGSILIGLTLAYVSVVLINELRKLIIGESIPREDRNRIKEIIKQTKEVEHINRIKTMTMGKNSYLLLVSVTADDDAEVYKVEDFVGEMKKDIMKEFPIITEIYIEVGDK